MLTLTGTAASGCMYVCIRIEIWLQLGYADKDRSILIIAVKVYVSTLKFIINFRSFFFARNVISGSSRSIFRSFRFFFVHSSLFRIGKY